MKKILALLALLTFFSDVTAMAAPLEDLQAAAEFAKVGNKSEATPLLEGIIANQNASPNLKAQAYFVLAALEQEPSSQIALLDKALVADPSFVRAYERKALRLFETRQFSEAAQAARAVLNLQPKNINALTIAAKSLFETTDYSGAAEAAALVLEIQPDNKEMLLCKAYSYYYAENYPLAAAAFSDCIKGDNRNGKLYLLRGHSYQLARQQNKALADLTTAQRYSSQLSPQEQNDLLVYRGLTYLDSGQFDLATGDFTRALSQSSEQTRKEELERLVAETATQKAVYEAMKQTRKDLEKAQNYIRKGNTKSAAVLLQNIVGAPEVINELKARAYVMLSKTDASFEVKLAHIEKSISLDPHDPEAYLLKGYLLLSLGNAQKAVASLTRAIELSPEDPAPFFYRGKALLLLEDWASAMKDFTNVMHNEADHYDRLSYAPKARAALMLGDLEQAREDMEKAKLFAKRFDGESELDYYYSLGLLAQADKKYEEAAGSYSSALKSLQASPYHRDLTRRIDQLESLNRWLQKR